MSLSSFDFLKNRFEGKVLQCTKGPIKTQQHEGEWGKTKRFLNSGTIMPTFSTLEMNKWRTRGHAELNFFFFIVVGRPSSCGMTHQHKENKDFYVFIKA